LNWRLSVDELQYVITDASPALLLFDEHFTDMADSLKNNDATNMQINFANVGNDAFPPTPVQTHYSAAESMGNNKAPLLIVYTSGTTGRPKGAVLTEEAILCSADMSLHMLNFTSADRVLNVLPLFHVGGLNIQPLPALINGATVVLHARFDPIRAVKTLAEDNISLMTTVPTVLQAMIATTEWEELTFPSLRAMNIGSTDVPITLIEAAHACGVPVLQVYGATETSPTAIYQRAEDAEQIGSIGKVGSRCEGRLVDESGKDVPVGESGEIWVKGQNILTNYWNNKDATALAITDGWFHTGDVAHADNNGYYWFDDRLKHVIISGGENIYPAEIERLVMIVPGVIEAVVVGKSDKKWGEVPIAVVVGDVDKRSILDACSGIAKFKQPRDVTFIEALPRNAMGKVTIDQVKKLVFNAS